MALQFIQTDTEQLGADALAHEVIEKIKDGKNVLWLVPGGSNIPISVKIMNAIRAAVTEAELEKLFVTLTDERYGPVGHADSNWQQLIDAGFIFPFNSLPVLFGGSLEDTVKAYGEHTEKLFANADYTIAQFGIGADGHIAGVLPHTIGVASRELAVGYESGALTRISLSLQTLSRLDSAYAFVFGASKADAVHNLHTDMSFDDMPSQILRSLPRAHIYTDQNAIDK